MEYASRRLRLSVRTATSAAAISVNAATHIIGRVAPVSRSVSRPNTYTETLRTVNTPALTTATACSSADTGAGATMAAGSQRCTGISAALPMPNR